MDADGTKAGFDNDLIAQIASRVRIPVIASGAAAQWRTLPTPSARARTRRWPPRCPLPRAAHLRFEALSGRRGGAGAAVTDLSCFFEKGELIPAIVQDASDGTVLMLAYMNAESLRLTLETLPLHLLQPQPRQAVDEGRDERKFPRRRRGVLRLRLRHAARQGQARGAGLPHGQPHLLLPPAGRKRLYRREHKPMTNETFDALPPSFGTESRTPPRGRTPATCSIRGWTRF